MDSNDPYDILGVPPHADDRAVRAAYLDLVRRFPPERFPERFIPVNKAYETLKTEKDRLNHELFDRDPGISSPFQALLVHFARAETRRPDAFEDMKSRLRKCATR